MLSLFCLLIGCGVGIHAGVRRKVKRGECAEEAATKGRKYFTFSARFGQKGFWSFWSSGLRIAERFVWEEDSVTEGPWLSCLLSSALRRHQLILSPPAPRATRFFSPELGNCEYLPAFLKTEVNRIQLHSAATLAIVIRPATFSFFYSFIFSLPACVWVCVGQHCLMKFNFIQRWTRIITMFCVDVFYYWIVFVLHISCL